MDIDKLEQQYSELKKTTSYSEHQNFISQLLSSDDPEVLDFHFKLLKDRENWNFYTRLRSAFKKRGLIIEDFLIDKIQNESDSSLKADALHLLGQIGSQKAVPIARNFINSDSSSLRETACYVIGWLGSKDDVDHIADRVFNDPDNEIRATAATSLDQIRLRIPETKEKLTSILKKALENEKDEETLAWIIITLQYIMEKKFGLKENIDEAEWSGDVEKAKQRALKSLADL